MKTDFDLKNIKIESGVRKPKSAAGKNSPIKEALSKMKKGQSFAIPYIEGKDWKLDKQIRSAVQVFKKQNPGSDFTIRNNKMSFEIRVLER